MDEAEFPLTPPSIPKTIPIFVAKIEHLLPWRVL